VKSKKLRTCNASQRCRSSYPFASLRDSARARRLRVSARECSRGEPRTRGVPALVIAQP
jgi:hypothetical protein